METYDDRPISVYDNLNIASALHTSTPKAARAPAEPTMSTTPATTSATNGATHTPYADISFRFNDGGGSNKTQQPYLLPTSNRSFDQSSQPLKQQQQQSQQQQQQQQQNLVQAHPHSATAAYYATPFKPTTSEAATSAAKAAPTTASSPLRPLSQHSQSELNEASQNIAAVKAALNDAKSKFFGLNGYAQDSPDTGAVPAAHTSQTYKLLPARSEQKSKPNVQILTTASTPLPPAPPPPPTPPNKTQPKYQNIPENSAIFRQQPPELPPKPSFPTAAPNADNCPAADATPASSSPFTPQTLSVMETSTFSPMTPGQQDKVLPHGSTYKQIPLNDFEASQPSQAVYMSTTVPQNIKGSKIAGRHTPTRNSLRHSRMLVVNNKNYRGMQHPNPMNFKYPNLARWVLILQIIIGALVSCLSIWIFVLSPSTALQDNPYWSGLALLLAGILGLVLVRYRRIKRHKVRENCFLFLRADSYLLSLLALLLCTVALICAAIHHVRLTASDTHCEPTNILLEHGSCSCTFNAVLNATNATTDYAALGESTEHRSPIKNLTAQSKAEQAKSQMADNSYKVEYRDLSCQEVQCEWIYMLALSITLNTFGFVVCFLYIVLLACCQHSSKRFYASVHTSTF